MPAAAMNVEDPGHRRRRHQPPVRMRLPQVHHLSLRAEP